MTWVISALIFRLFKSDLTSLQAASKSGAGTTGTFVKQYIVVVMSQSLEERVYCHLKMLPRSAARW